MTKVQIKISQLCALDLLMKEIEQWENFYENLLANQKKELTDPAESTSTNDIEDTEIRLETMQSVKKLIEKEFLK